VTALLAVLLRRYARRPVFWLPVAVPPTVALAFLVATSPLAVLWTRHRPRPPEAGLVVLGLGLVVVLLTFLVSHWLLAEEEQRGTLVLLLAGPSADATPAALLLVGICAGVLAAVAAFALAVGGLAPTQGLGYAWVLAQGAVRVGILVVTVSSLGLMSAAIRPRWDLAVAAAAAVLAPAAVFLEAAGTGSLVALAIAALMAWWLAWGWRRRRSGA